jgi:hypothetical protein
MKMQSCSQMEHFESPAGMNCYIGNLNWQKRPYFLLPVEWIATALTIA